MAEIKSWYAVDKYGQFIARTGSETEDNARLKFDVILTPTEMHRWLSSDKRVVPGDTPLDKVAEGW